jgi:hypothetical protein
MLPGGDSFDNRIESGTQPAFQSLIGDVAAAQPDEHVIIWRVAQCKIVILGHKNIVLRSAKFSDFRVRSFSGQNLCNVCSFMSPLNQSHTQPGRELRIDKKLHSAAKTTGWSKARAAY